MRRGNMSEGGGESKEFDGVFLVCMATGLGKHTTNHGCSLKKM